MTLVSPQALLDMASHGLMFVAYFLLLVVILGSMTDAIFARDQIGDRLTKSSTKLIDSLEEDLASRRRANAARKKKRAATSWLGGLIVEAGARHRLALLLAVAAGSALALLLATYLATRSAAGAITVSVLAAFAGPLLFLLIMRRRRMQRFEAQLPDALDTMVRSMRAGHPLPVSIKLVVQEYPEPVGEEFAIVADELTYGLELEMAMRNLSNRIHLHDLALVVSAISITRKSGGNLAEILSSLAGVIRDRLRMRLKVRALSAEGRFSAYALGLLPVFLFFTLQLVAPTYYGDVWQHKMIVPIFVLAGLWMLIGIIVMWKMVSFEI
jgi:tight adherence protein B